MSGKQSRRKLESLRDMSLILKKILSFNLTDDEQLLREQLLQQKRAKIAEDAFDAGTVEIGTHFARVYIALGAAAIFLNLTILIILLIHRRHAFRHVFYLLIFNFAAIDCLKGVCLIAYALRMLKVDQIETIKFDQIMTMVFRICNFATILSLLMITLNEFVFIKYPLRYHQLIDRRLTLILIGLTWVLCIVFTTAFTYSKGTGGRVYVNANYTNDLANLKLSEDNGTADMRSNLWRQPNDGSQGMDIHYIFAFTLTAFCLTCLLVVLICYAIFFRVIREIQLYDNRLYQDANRRVSELSTNSSELPPGTVTSDRKLKRQLLRRNKYAFVIGLVILVCMLYLITYSTIQIFQFFHLDNSVVKKNPIKRRESYVVRWVLQILVGLHSIFQPLCYFRMKEFRQYVHKLFCIMPCCPKTEKSYGVPVERDYFTSCAETGGFGMQHQNSVIGGGAKKNSIVMVKSTNHFRDRFYMIFSRKKQQEQRKPSNVQAPPTPSPQFRNATSVIVEDDKENEEESPKGIITNNNKIRRSVYYESDVKNANASATNTDEELAKELATLMQNNSGTDL